MLFELVCSPRIIYVASKQDASTLFSQVDRVIPVNTEYTLHFTDGQVRSLFFFKEIIMMCTYFNCPYSV